MSIELQPVISPEDVLTPYDELAALVSAELHSQLVPAPRRFVDEAYWSYPEITAAFDAVMVAGVEDGDAEDLAALIFELNIVQDSLSVPEACDAT